MFSRYISPLGRLRAAGLIAILYMAPKRPNGQDDITGRAKKKLKISAARTIAVQSNQPDVTTTKLAEKTTHGYQQTGCEWSVDRI